MAETDRISELYEELSGGENFLTKAYLDYLENNADLKSVQALTTASEFIPGISTALAKRRDDKFGEALSYLDYLGPGGAAVKMMAIPAKSAINVGRQRFMLDPKWVKRKTTTRSGAPKVTGEVLKRQNIINKEEGLGSLIPTRKNLPKVRTPQQQISSLQHQLHRKMSERNQEGHLMSTYNLTKITNEIDALEARIAALTLKIGK